MKRILIVFFLFGNLAYSQEGDFFITHFSPEYSQIENENFAITQDGKGWMAFANSRGVLKFDGRFWDMVRTPSSAVSITYDETKRRTFVGCLNGLGYVEEDEYGSEQYKSIYMDNTAGHAFSKLTQNSEYLYALSEDMLLAVDKATLSFAGVAAMGNSRFVSLFKIKDEVFVQNQDLQLFLVKNAKVYPAPSSMYIPQRVLFARNAGDVAILCTEANTLYKSDGSNMVPFLIEGQAYLQSSVAQSMVTLGSNILAIGTIKGGVLLVNAQNGKKIATINYFSGLPDDEVFALGVDGQNGIWVAHEYGMSRIDMRVPFRSFTYYPGLEGHVEAVAEYKSRIYMATSEGLYYLDKVQNLTELKAAASKKIKAKEQNEEKKEGKLNTSISSQKNKFERLKSFLSFGRRRRDTSQLVPAESTPTKEDAKAPKQKKGILGLFSKKSKKYSIPSDSKPATNPSTEEANAKKSPASKQPINQSKGVGGTKSIKEPVQPNDVDPATLSISYVYKKVKGINGKCRQILSFGGKLYIATNEGLYEYTTLSTKKIITDNIVFMHLSSAKNTIWIGTQDSKLLQLRYIDNAWQNSLIYQSKGGEYISSILEDTEMAVWVSFSSQILHVGASSTDTIAVPNPFSDDVVLALTDKKVRVYISNQVFKIHSKTLVLDTTSSYKDGQYFRLVHSQSNKVWVNNNRNWSCVGECDADSKNLSFFNLFKEIKEIFQYGKVCWVITKSNEVFKLNLETASQMDGTSNIVLRSVVRNDGMSLSKNALKIDETNSNLSFAFGKPEYLDNQYIQYQFIIEGLMKDWTPWSEDNKLNISYIPSGNYTLRVRAKNSLGQVFEGQSFAFKVIPPYWNQWWFYLIEVVFFGSLMFGSAYLNRSNKGYPWMSKVLTFITIVMIIEFINTIFDYVIRIPDSPVYNFGVQVVMGLLIFPFERVLSGIITNRRNVLNIRRKGKQG